MHWQLIWKVNHSTRFVLECAGIGREHVLWRSRVHLYRHHYYMTAVVVLMWLHLKANA
jgi:hypothetical protein